MSQAQETAEHPYSVITTAKSASRPRPPGHPLNLPYNQFITDMVKSSPFFQSSLALSFQGTPPITTLSTNSPSPDPDKLFHHCIGKKSDTTRIYPTLPLELDSKFVVAPPPLFRDRNNDEKLQNWAKQRITKAYKITPVKKQRAQDLFKQSKIIFSVEI